MFTALGLLSAGLTALIVAATLLSHVPVPHGAVRYLDFPRLQILALAAVAAVMVAVGDMPPFWRAALLLLLGAAAMDQGAHVLRFTPLWRRQSVASGPAPDRDAQVSLLSSNVKMSNRNHAALAGLLRRYRPDIFIAMEVDDGWVEGLAEVMADYPHRLTHPLSNSYGMLLWSRLPLAGATLRHLLVADVPSIRTRVRLRDGRQVELFVLHPEPPVPHHDTEGRDAEIGLVGIETTHSPLPAIVAGDLNDVAWSRTTRRFQRLSGLLDPRVGRGLYNSFDARFFFLRWPLDHLFHDARFRLVALKRLPSIGSDHFPMLFVLELNGGRAQGEEIGAARPEDHAEIREMAAREARRNRRPLAEDWE